MELTGFWALDRRSSPPSAWAGSPIQTVNKKTEHHTIALWYISFMVFLQKLVFTTIIYSSVKLIFRIFIREPSTSMAPSRDLNRSVCR
jgi:hypothetical protein